MSEVNDIFRLISSAQRILILVKGIFSTSEIKQISSLTAYIKSKSKEYQVCLLDKQDEPVMNTLRDLEIDVTDGVKPSEYIVTIDYANSGIEKVVYDTDKENGKLIFKILPSKSGFNFNNVQFTEGGGTFDGTITIGIDNPQDLRSFYDENEYLFKQNQVFKIKAPKEITAILSTNIAEITPELANIMLKNVVQTLNIVEGSPEQEDIKNVLNLVDLGGNLYESLREKYYSKPETYLDVIKLLLKNTRLDSEEVIYSIVLKKDVGKYGLDTFLNIGRLPFNYIKKYELALLFIQNSDDIMYLVVQANNISRFSAQTIAGVFGGQGDTGHATTKLDGILLNELNKRFCPILKDLYNIDLELKIEIENVDNSPQVLTKGRRNSKNKGLNKSK